MEEIVQGGTTSPNRVSYRWGEDFGYVPSPEVPRIAPSTQVIEHRHTNVKDNDVKVKVTKAATKEGSYGWEITYEGGSTAGVVATILDADKRLREAFIG